MDNIWPEIFIVESMAIVTGNLLTIVVLSNASSLKKRGNWLIINLAVADLLIGAFSEPLYIATLKGYLKDFAVYTSVDIFLGVVSVLGLTALALDRLFAVSRPFQHRTISDKAYVVVIVVIWVIPSGISILSFLASKNRFLVFFYIVLPLLTISQLLMIVSYITIWIIVKSRRPHGRRLRRQKAQLITQRGSVTKTKRSASQDQETGSITFSVSEKEYSSLLSDYKTRSIRDYLRTTSDDTESVRDSGVFFGNKTGSIRDYLVLPSADARTVQDPWVLYDNKTNPTRDYVGSTIEDTGSVRHLWVSFDNKTNPVWDYPDSISDDTGSTRDYIGPRAEDTGSVHNLQNGPCETCFTNQMDDTKRTPKWKSRLSSRKSINNLNNSKQKTIESEDMKTENPKLCTSKNCQRDSLSVDSTRVFNCCTMMIKDWTRVNSSSRNPNNLRLQRNSPRFEPYDRDNKLAMTLFIATAVSLLAWLPFEVMNIIMSLCFSCRVQLYNIHVLSFTKFLHYANSFVNPIIYTFRIQEFRRAINKILKSPMKRREGDAGRRTSLELSMLSTWRNRTCETRES